MTAATSWKEEELESISATHSPWDWYNADETGIFFRALPDSTYVCKKNSRQGHGFKEAKDQITVLVTCNMMGEKEPLLIIGKAKKPRAFKNLKSFPAMTSYESSKMRG